MLAFNIKVENLKKIIYTIGYCIIYILCYIFFLNRYFEYAGFTLYNMDIAFITLSVLIAVFPILFYKKYKAISSFITSFIYILLYIPIIITFALGSNLPMIKIIEIQIGFLICMVFLFYADRFVIIKGYSFRLLKNKNIKKIMFTIIISITIVLTLYVVFLYQDNLRLVSFGEEVYKLRTENNKYGTGLIAGYLSSWLSVVFIPICLAYGLIYKKKLFFIVACISSLIIYMATGSKGIILFPFLFFVCNIFFKLVFKKNIYIKIVFILFIFLLILFFIPDSAYIIRAAKSIIMWRTIGNGGYLTIWYYDFFSKNPHTYYSHINIINAITENYPYDVTLGFVVGRAYWSPNLNANANFWATDGIAALGMPGVIIITFIFFIIQVFHIQQYSLANPPKCFGALAATIGS